MSEQFSVENSSIFFLVEESSRVNPTFTFLERRGLKVQVHTDIKDFLLCCAEHHPQFLAISVNHHNPKVFELIEVLGGQLSCEVIVFAEKPDRRSLPLIRRARKAHKLLGAMSGPSVMLKMRKIMRKTASSSSDSGKIVVERIEGGSNPSAENFLITEGKAHSDQTFISDLRGRGDGPAFFKGDPSNTGSVLLEDGRGTGPSIVSDSAPEGSELSASTQVEVEDVTYKQVAQWIEDSLKYTVKPGSSETLPFPPDTKKLAIVQVKDSTESGFIVLASSQEDELKKNLLGRLHENLKKLKNPPAGPQWESFRLLDVDVNDVQNWLRGLTQARVLSKHQSMELMASFLASKENLPKLTEAFKGHYALSPSNLKPDWPIDYDTFLHLKLNDKLLQYVAKGGTFSKEQIERLMSLQGSRLLIKQKDLELFEAQFLRENILQLMPKSQKKKAA